MTSEDSAVVSLGNSRVYPEQVEECRRKKKFSRKIKRQKLFSSSYDLLINLGASFFTIFLAVVSSLLHCFTIQVLFRWLRPDCVQGLTSFLCPLPLFPEDPFACQIISIFYADCFFSLLGRLLRFSIALSIGGKKLNAKRCDEARQEINLSLSLSLRLADPISTTRPRREENSNQMTFPCM